MPYKDKNMPSQKKIDTVAELTETVKERPIAILAEYRGLKHSQMTDLRRSCRKLDARFVVVKNRLMKLALQNAGQPAIDDLLVDTTVIAFTAGDPSPLAKMLSDYARKNEALQIKGALVDGTKYTAEQVKVLATLPPREIIMSQVAGGVVGGVRGIACGLNELMAGLARVIDQVAQQKAAA